MGPLSLEPLTRLWTRGPGCLWSGRPQQTGGGSSPDFLDRLAESRARRRDQAQHQGGGGGRIFSDPCHRAEPPEPKPSARGSDERFRLIQLEGHPNTWFLVNSEGYSIDVEGEPVTVDQGQLTALARQRMPASTPTGSKPYTSPAARPNAPSTPTNADLRDALEDNEMGRVVIGQIRAGQGPVPAGLEGLAREIRGERQPQLDPEIRAAIELSPHGRETLERAEGKDRSLAFYERGLAESGMSEVEYRELFSLSADGQAFLARVDAARAAKGTHP